jgi:hypothetical protein
VVIHPREEFKQKQRSGSEVIEGNMRFLEGIKGLPRYERHILARKGEVVLAFSS